MTIEERLQEKILTQYSSIREFTISIGMANSTFTSMMKRGLPNANIKNVIKVCKALDISADALLIGEIKPIRPIDIVKDLGLGKDAELEALILELTESEKEQVTQYIKFLLQSKGKK